MSAGGLGFGADVFLPGGHYSIDGDGGGLYIRDMKGTINHQGGGKTMVLIFPPSISNYGFSYIYRVTQYQALVEIWSDRYLLARDHAYVPVGMV